MLKRILTIVLVGVGLLLSISLIGCGSKENSEESAKFDEEGFTENIKNEFGEINEADINDMIKRVKEENGIEVENIENVEIDNQTVLNDLMKNFNDSWITYVNDGSTKILDYIVKDSEVQDDIYSFDRNGVKEQLLEMTIKNINVEEDIAKIHVYEKYKKVSSDSTKTKDYNWVYTAVKDPDSDNWLIESYTFDE